MFSYGPIALLILGAPLLVNAQEDFRIPLQEAVRRGDSQFIVPAGEYHMKPMEGESTHIVVKNAKDLVIHAEGATLICEDLTRAITFVNCRNVTLKGLRVDYDPLPFTQGKIVEVAKNFESVDVKLHQGYPLKPYSRIDVIDPATRFRKRGMPFLWGTKAEMISADVVRVHLKDIGKAAAVGDLASLSAGPREGGQPHAVAIENCAGMIFEDVTVFAAPGFGIIEQDGEGGMRYSRCKVIPGPKPTGAIEERLLSSSWDAMQSKTMKRGPLVEECVIREAGDDSWSIQSSDYLVVAVQGSKAILAFRDPHCAGPQAGDRLVASLDAKPIRILEQKSISLPTQIREKIEAAKPWTLWKTSIKAVEVAIDGTFPYQVGDSVYCPDRQGAGFVFRSNSVHSSGRILIKAGYGLIENNKIFNGHSGVTVAPEVPDEAAAGIRNLTIRGNTFIGTGYFCPSPWSTQAGCVSVASNSKKKIFEEIIIENNHFEDINGPAIVLFDTEGASIEGNCFCQIMKSPPNSTGESFGVSGGSLIWLKNTSRVNASNNTVHQAGPYFKQTASGDPGVEAGILKSLEEAVAVSKQPCLGKVPTAK